MARSIPCRVAMPDICFYFSGFSFGFLRFHRLDNNCNQAWHFWEIHIRPLSKGFANFHFISSSTRPPTLLPRLTSNLCSTWGERIDFSPTRIVCSRLSIRSHLRMASAVDPLPTDYNALAHSHSHPRCVADADPGSCVCGYPPYEGTATPTANPVHHS